MKDHLAALLPRRHAIDSGQVFGGTTLDGEPHDLVVSYNGARVYFEAFVGP